MITKEDFKQRWKSDDLGGGITYQDIADCYVNWRLGSYPKTKPIFDWRLGSYPKTKPIFEVRYQVLKAANTIDAEDYNPDEEEEEEEE